MTQEMQNKLKEQRIVVGVGDRQEKWLDKDGTIIPINRCPIDWQVVLKPTKGGNNDRP
jgi:hypothetical protein